MVGATIPARNSIQCMWSPYAPLYDRSTQHCSGLHATTASHDIRVRTSIARNERSHEEWRSGRPPGGCPTDPHHPLCTSRPRRARWRDPPSRPNHCRYRSRARRACASRSELFFGAGRSVLPALGTTSVSWAARHGIWGFRRGRKHGAWTVGADLSYWRQIFEKMTPPTQTCTGGGEGQVSEESMLRERGRYR
jgi:hypothetical protein